MCNRKQVTRQKPLKQEATTERLKTEKEAWESRKIWPEEICPEVLEKGIDFFDIDKINAAIKEGYVASIYKRSPKQKRT